MFRLKHKRIGEYGDTIVEVLVAIAVISTVVAGAYIVANVNTEQERQAEERSEALQLLETQIEEIRNDAANSTANVAGMGTTQAFSLSTLTPGAVGTPGTTFCLDSSNDLFTSAISTNCSFNSGGVTTAPSSTSQVTYNITVSPIANSSGSGELPYTLQLSAKWNAVGGGLETASLVYRVYQ